MMDDIDEGARTGVWVALGVVAFLLFGLLGSLMIRQINIGKATMAARTMAATPAAVPAAVSAAAPAAAALPLLADEMKDVALTGVVAGTLYFASGSAVLPADAGLVLSGVRDVAAAQTNRNLLISGFHDATGDPAKNAELAKERAKAVRESLASLGVDRARMVMRKPESTTGSTTGGADNAEARRVEVRAVE